MRRGLFLARDFVAIALGLVVLAGASAGSGVGCTAAQLQSAETTVATIGAACPALSGVSIGAVAVGSICSLFAALVQGLLTLIPIKAGALRALPASANVDIFFGPHDAAHRIGDMHPDVAPELQRRLDALAAVK